MLALTSALLIAFATAPSEESRTIKQTLEDLSEVRWVKTIDAIHKVNCGDVALHLYTKKNVEEPHLIGTCDIESLLNSSLYKEQHSNFFIIHGWRASSSNGLIVNIVRAVLEEHDVNVFVVDWNRPASEIYLKAKANVPRVGVVLGNFINEMIEELKLNPSDFRLVGHSLGAHLAGCAGAQVSQINGKVNYIVGLDPAGPLYYKEDVANRLDPTDAEFVHVIHTNDGKLGLKRSVGHADYYPNGGNSQPGCVLDKTGRCSHLRSLIYFAESIASSEFLAVRCDSYENFEDGLCESNPTSLMGGFFIDKGASGDYYLKTDQQNR